MRARWIFVVVIGLADCGSVPADTEDASAQDAATDDVADACSTPFACVDAQSDAPPIDHVVCPDGGYVTINGDGDAATLTASFIGMPVAYFVDCCGDKALVVVASANSDGGASMQLERASSENPDGGLTLLAGPNIANYYSADGVMFSSYWNDASVTTAFTQVDPPGGVVAGSYAVTVVSSKQADAATLSLSGSFLTCRVHDAVCACPPPPP